MLKSAITTDGAQCVTVGGADLMQEWSVANWGILHWVRVSKNSVLILTYTTTICTVYLEHPMGSGICRSSLGPNQEN